ncbi:aconitate hydratase AcnA [Actinoplanes sp. NPDC051411]|uniref:aconitate hydratase AcnA n=1 Tax=Actinoplanes sp. NPDC051411 TaxID=3155522 RepID=UPI00342E9DC7
MDSFDSLARLELDGRDHRIHRLDRVPGADARPVSLKIVIENLLRHEDGRLVTAERIRSLAQPRAHGDLAFHPSRAFLHDTNGVPVLADLAALRDAVAAAGHDPATVNPSIPAELTVDHSIATDVSGHSGAWRRNTEFEYTRNAERYEFLKWGTTLDGFRIVPPGHGIMHQINLERLARVVESRDGWAYPDTCAGTDSHTTMVNALGVLAWGVGGIEAEAALLGQPITMTVPPVVGVVLDGELAPGVTATDLVLTITQVLRRHGVVGSFVEFVGPGAARLPVATRATIANMAPEAGATTAMFPIDDLTLDYLRFTGRSPGHVDAVERYCKEQGLWHDPGFRPDYDSVVHIDLGVVETAIAGPRRPQDRVPLAEAASSFRTMLAALPARESESPVADGAVAIAAITSCTNTSNPQVMIGAGLLARNARRRGLKAKPWVKTSLAPGSRAVVDYLDAAGLSPYLDELGFQLVGLGCMTCIGNSGPLLPTVAEAVRDHGVRVVSVLSGNRNFDGRINNDVSLNYLASPPLVVAYALAGSMEVDLLHDPLGFDDAGEPVHLADIWPDDAEIASITAGAIKPAMYTESYADLFEGDEHWSAVPAPSGLRYEWSPDSTYLRRPPFLDRARAAGDILASRVLLLLGDSVTTDHISPAGRIPRHSEAGNYLTSRGVAPADLNTYAARRGNWEVMIRGGFTNPRLDSGLGSGGRTADFTAGGTLTPIHVAAGHYARAGTPLLVLAGEDYGGGSSRDWAAKVTALLGVRAVIACSFERIHRGNLVQLGVLPLQFQEGDNAAKLGLDGAETFDLIGVDAALDQPRSTLTVCARRNGAPPIEFDVTVRIDTAREAEYYRSGGILPFVYRTLVGES